MTAADTTPDTGLEPVLYDQAHTLYRAAGWTGPLPLPPGRKYPPPDGWTGYHGGDPSGADSWAWANEQPLPGEPDYRGTAQLALRMPAGVIGVDVDDYADKHGATTIRHAVTVYGALPRTWRSTARGAGQPSGILFYRVRADTAFPGVLKFPELQLADVELIQRHHRYAVAWPSVHPDTDTPYLWYSPDGVVHHGPPPVDALPWLPDGWYALARDLTPGAEAADDAAVQAFARTHSTGDNTAALTAIVDKYRATARDVHVARHDAMHEHACWAAREAALGRFPAADAVRELRGAFVHDVTTGPAARRDFTAADARQEFARSWAWAVAQADAMTVDQVAERAARHHDTGSQAGGRVLSRGNTSALAGGGDYLHAPVAEPAHAAATDPAPDDELDLSPDSGWRPLDLGPYLAGTVTRPDPDVGIVRRDGVRLFYAGKEHALIGEMESGKSWAALASVAAELAAGNTVLYIHFEEDDPSDSVERLLLLGAAPDRIRDGFRFIAPQYAITPDVVDALLQLEPSLVILDGQNEAMAMHGHGINDPDGAAAYRRALVKPFTAAGAAVVSCDHVTKDSEKSSKGYALGSIHKGNGISGTIILLENVEPFGIGRRGMSRICVTKDRPGKLRVHGRPTDVARKFYLGDLVVDSTDPDRGLELTWWPQRGEDDDPLPETDRWDAGQVQLPDDVVAYRASGRGAMLDLARFVRHRGQGGLGVDLSGATQALCAVKTRGQAKHTRDTVRRAWGGLHDLGRLAVADANASGNPRGLHWWMPRPDDPDHG